MILMRLTMPACSAAAGALTGRSTPSMRCLSRSSPSCGSTWMSEARAATASAIIWLTSRTTGTSLAMSLSRSTSAGATASPASVPGGVAEAPSRSP